MTPREQTHTQQDGTLSIQSLSGLTVAAPASGSWPRFAWACEGKSPMVGRGLILLWWFYGFCDGYFFVVVVMVLWESVMKESPRKPQRSGLLSPRRLSIRALVAAC